ncbi:MAG: protease modulator HflC [Rickettsiales bacterium]|nr:protease modulator HflC [Rickettsiales bacterium]OUV83189.1 MAG: protease modulator HflC [Rickettsiales bacterium TMED131]
MKKSIGFLLGVVVLLTVIAYNSLFFVEQRIQALILQFGEPIRVIQEPGLNFKIPLAQNIVKFDKRILLFDNNAEEIIAADKKRLIVDAFVRYKIVDPLKFYQTVRFEAALNNRLGSVVNNSLRAVLGRVPLEAVISDRRELLMQEVSGLVAQRASQFGISIEEVRIKKADLPSENSEAIYRRMQTERQQEAAQIRAIGEEKARFIRAESEKQKTVLLAEAQRDSDILRGQGDAEKNKILGKAFNKDPDFFAFYRAMQAYTRALSEGDTTMVLSPNSDFFEFFGNAQGNLR